MAASLDGKVVAYLETRMGSEMGSLIERHGGVPYPAPVLQEIYRSDSPDVQQLVDDLCRGAVQIMVLLTGVGTQALIESATAMGRREEFLQSLDHRTIIARSPKPARVLRRHKVHIDLMPPEPFTSQDMLDSLADINLQDMELAVQAYGAPNGFLTRNLTERGANVREVSLYTWGLPADLGPAIGLIDELPTGRIDALAFTSQPQVGNLFSIASQAGNEEALRAGLEKKTLAIASVGPVCTRRMLEAGIRVDVEPEHPHMGNLIMALADHLQPGN